MSARLRIYLTAVFGLALVTLVVAIPGDLGARGVHYLAWLLICVLSDMMWQHTVSGEGTWSLSSTAMLSSVVLWGPRPAIWITAAATLIAEVFVLRKPLIRAAFNGAQIALTMAVAGLMFVALGGPAAGLAAHPPAPPATGAALQLVPPVVALFAGYLLVNRALVAVAVAWSTERPYMRVLREDWFYAARLLADLSAFTLSPLMVVGFLSIGYVGVVLFYAPLFMIFESDRRYVELRKAQTQIIHSERMAAKGEMAAEIGHELRNQLAAISGRAQMIVREAERGELEGAGRHAQIILDQSRRMEGLSKGLMDFTRAELNMERVDLNALVQRSIEFVRTQNRFDGVEWKLALVEPGPTLRADSGQLQQVLLNLFLNAADAMKINNGHRKVIGVASAVDERMRALRLQVSDTGTGISPANLRRIFEPHFTTKQDGHGFGLSTSYRIIENHGGRITVQSPPGEGATFTIVLPLHGPGGWS
jgi:signal transduction histidine kinase